MADESRAMVNWSELIAPTAQLLVATSAGVIYLLSARQREIAEQIEDARRRADDAAVARLVEEEQRVNELRRRIEVPMLTMAQ